MTSTGPEGPRTVVHLLRHAEVENPGGVLYGREPGFGLSAHGHRTADEVGAALADRDVVLVVASPMQRAQETARPLAGRLDLEVETDERLVESANRLQGREVGLDTRLLRQPRVWPYLWNPWRPSWGEPYREVADRVAAVVEEVRVRAAGHEAVLVSHQVPIWVTRRRREGRRLAHDPRRRQCALGSVTSLHFTGEVCTGVSYRPAEVDGTTGVTGATA